MTTVEQLYEVYDSRPYFNSADRVTLEKQWQMKVARFEDNVALGEPIAMVAHSLAAAKGIGTKADPNTACRMARRAYDTGHQAGVAMLAYCLWKGIGIEKNLLAAEKTLGACGDNPSPFAALIYAEMLSETSPSDAERIERFYTIASKAGVASAGIRLLERRFNAAGGDLIKLNKILDDLKIYTNRKYADAGWLGYRCYCAKPKPLSNADRDAAVALLKMASEQGMGTAQLMYAKEHFQEEWLTGNLSLKPDLAVAFRWAEAAHTDPSLDEEDLADSKSLMAMCLMSGRGTKQDVQKGLRLANQSEGMKTKNSVNMTVWLLSKGSDFLMPPKLP